jgi:hypothetical protein
MHKDASEPRASRARLERAVVLELLGDEGASSRTLSDLADALGASSDELDLAVSSLDRAGVLSVADGSASTSAATRRLDELELIGV